MLPEFEQKHKVFRCKLCEAKFFSNRGRNRHEMKDHGEQPVHICDECGETLNAKHNYTYHMQKKHRETRYVAADICSYETIVNVILQRHRLYPYPPRPTHTHTSHDSHVILNSLQEDIK